MLSDQLHEYIALWQVFKQNTCKNAFLATFTVKEASTLATQDDPYITQVLPKVCTPVHADV